jgi:hypothetical protein
LEEKHVVRRFKHARSFFFEPVNIKVIPVCVKRAEVVYFVSNGKVKAGLVQLDGSFDSFKVVVKHPFSVGLHGMKMIMDNVKLPGPLSELCVKRLVFPPFLVAHLALELLYESGLESGFHYIWSNTFI